MVHHPYQHSALIMFSFLRPYCLNSNFSFFLELNQPSYSLFNSVQRLTSIFPSIRLFSNESVIQIRLAKYWSFSFNISPSNEYSGLISFRMDWLELCVVQGTLNTTGTLHTDTQGLSTPQFSPTVQFKASILRCSAFFIVQISSIQDYWKNHSFEWTDIGWQSNISAF